MSALTKEWLQQTIADLEEERDATPGAVNEDAAKALAAMKLALASLEAEAVCVIDQSNLDYLKSGADADVWPASRKEMGDVLLYRTAPPAPVSVPEEVSWEDVPEEITEDDMALASAWAHGFNQCRAALLQGADGALTNEDAKRVDELVMWVKRLAHSLRKANPDSKLQSDAMDYLSRNGLIGAKDILR